MAEVLITHHHQESYTYNDPVTDFISCLYHHFDFEGAQKKLVECKTVCGVVWCDWCGVVWCGVVWCGVVWCGVVWCGVVGCGVVWCGVVWCGVAWCGVVWCGVVWRNAHK